MIIEIEYFNGDVRLSGKKVSLSALKEQIKTIEELHDRVNDNFIALLCRMYRWDVIEFSGAVDFIYDRDIGKFFQPKHA
ncbi:hypothetical protein [Leminorella grimontii]|uniref:hypothetical protein n=1 Tax=Leminorella grimontii TaxID=82981 RepID=UPI0020891558|nr:hypothetical protein [Leminorella grimontii]GKX60122.1 hypothetical protein SOASR031_24370 [Leminorella grimontii]